jgi:ESCRT-II complex subunit VPS25
MAAAAPNRSLFVLSPLRRLGELADALWSYVESTGESGALVTLYELQTGDAARGQTFFGAEAMLLLQAARILEQRGKAAVIPAPVLSETGVKFLG